MQNAKRDLTSVKGKNYNIQGKFHSHITVLADSQAHIDKLTSFCIGRGMKPTIITDMASESDATRTSCMTTKYHFTDDPAGVEGIISQLEEASGALEAEGFEITRVKLEHEGLPTIQPFTRETYREVHLLAPIEQDDYEKAIWFLKLNARRMDYFLSRNPKAKPGVVNQFISTRYYDGTLDDANKRTAKLVSFLLKMGLSVREIKSETAVFDTNVQYDEWWTACAACGVCLPGNIQKEKPCDQK